MLTEEPQNMKEEEESSEEMTPEPPPPEKRRPGRPRGTRKKKKPGNCFKKLGNSSKTWSESWPSGRASNFGF